MGRFSPPDIFHPYLSQIWQPLWHLRIVSSASYRAAYILWVSEERDFSTMEVDRISKASLSIHNISSYGNAFQHNAFIQ